MKRQITAARREILMLLRRKGPQTVDGLSEAIGITPVGVRKHLDTLEIDGLVQTTIERRKVGRPAQVYSLTEAADDLFPKAYETTLAAVLRQLMAVGGEPLLNQVLDGRRDEMEARCRARATGVQSLEERVDVMARVRDEAGYMAEWSRANGTYYLTEFNCAICRVAHDFPQLCDSELDLFRRVLGSKVSVERVNHIVAGDRCCTYEIRAGS